MEKKLDKRSFSPKKAGILYLALLDTLPDMIENYQYKDLI